MSQALDEVLAQFSVFGRYHLCLLIFLICGNAVDMIKYTNFVFLTAEGGYSCKDVLIIDACSSRNSSAVCTEWVYDNPHTFVAEFQLACQEWKRTLVGTVHSIGYMVGLLIVGPVSDRIGRKLTLVITGTTGGVFGLLKSFSSWYWLYIVLEFFEAALGDNCSPMFVLTIEAVSMKNRVLFYILSSFGYSIGGMILPIAYWLTPNWRVFLRVMYSPALFFVFYLFVIDESPRWLLTKGKKNEAISIIQNAAAKSKIQIDPAVLDKLEYEKEKGISFSQQLKITFTSKTLAKRCLICVVWWITSTFVHYGMTINSVSLQGNKYINYIIISAVDIPGNLANVFIMNRFKRKVPLIVCFFAGAVMCISQPFVPISLLWLSISFYVVGKLMSSLYIIITYIFTSELFPTYTRNSMHALCSSLGRVGAIVAPQTPLLMQYWTGFPPMIFGTISLIAGFVTFFVPDTADIYLPNTVKQAETLGKPLEKDTSNENRDRVSYIFRLENREGKTVNIDGD